MGASLSDRVTALETSQIGLAANVANLGADVRGAQHEARRDIEAFQKEVKIELAEVKSAVGTLRQTNWPVMIGGFGLALTLAGTIGTVLMVIGSLAYNSLGSRIAISEQQMTREIEMRSDNARRSIEDVRREMDRHHPRFEHD